MECQSLFKRKTKEKNISKCRLLEFLPSMLSGTTTSKATVFAEFMQLTILLDRNCNTVRRTMPSLLPRVITASANPTIFTKPRFT